MMELLNNLQLLAELQHNSIHKAQVALQCTFLLSAKHLAVIQEQR